MTKLADAFDYHDFSLRDYTVRDYGRSILLDLVSHSEPLRETVLEFTDVIYYRFIHTGPAIITYILISSAIGFAGMVIGRRLLHPSRHFDTSTKSKFPGFIKLPIYS